MESTHGVEPEIDFLLSRRGGMNSIVVNFVCSLTKVNVRISLGGELSKVYDE